MDGFTARRNADGSYTVTINGKDYTLKDMFELVHFLEDIDVPDDKEN